MYEFNPHAGNTNVNYTLNLTLCIVIPSVFIIIPTIAVFMYVYIRKKRFQRF